MKTGLILFAHGARDPRWAVPFEAVARRVRELRPGAEVRLAFLELMAPDLAGAAQDLAAAGCTRVAVLPMFLGTGGHVRNDLPRILAALESRLGGVQFVLEPPVGEIDSVNRAMAAAAASCLPSRPGAAGQPEAAGGAAAARRRLGAPE
jgi:sirohydrochlorin cobaltochelatase